jgi:predicted amino acid dehydrogenase
MSVTRSQAKKLIKQMAAEYDITGKSQKSRILSSIVGSTGFVRSAVARVLRPAIATPTSK